MNVSEILIALFLLAGLFFFFIATIGLVRLPDLYTRMHAGTKAGTVAVSFMLASLALAYEDVDVTSRAIGAIIFIFLTAPVGSHMIGKAMRDQGYEFHKRAEKPSATKKKKTKTKTRRVG